MMSLPLPELHRRFLSAVLGIRPLAAPLCELARQVLPQGDALSGTLEAMRRACDGPTLQAACDDLAAALAETDVRGLLADLIVADLIDIEAGHYDHLNSAIATPVPGDPVYLRHVHHVRLTYHAMWGTPPFPS